MKITVTGTTEELKRTKQVIDSCCFFDNDECLNLKCEECERSHNLETEYILENKEE